VGLGSVGTEEAADCRISPLASGWIGLGEVQYADVIPP
jgi:hypothetical protein